MVMSGEMINEPSEKKPETKKNEHISIRIGRK